MSRAIVVGGGISGLACALRLQQQGVSVRVFEKAERAGGVIGSSCSEGYLREQAANGFLGRGDASAIELCEELGVEMCEASSMAKKRWICLDGKLHPLPSSPLAFARSELLSWRGKLAAMGEPLRAPGRQDLDESVGSFARRRFGDEVAAHFVAPFVTGIFAGDADALSLKAAFPTLAELDAQGGMVRGMIKRQLAARKNRGEGASKRGGGDRLSAPRDGVQALTAAVVKELGDAVECGAEVRSLELRDGRPHILLEGGAAHGADVVVLATPAHVTARIVSAASSALAKTTSSIPYAPVVVLHLGFDRSSIAHELDGFGFLVAAGGPMRILGCVFESVLWPGRAPDGKVLLRCIFGGSRDPDVCDLSDREIVDAACRDLDTTLGLRGEPEHINVTRWPSAISQYTIGHCERVAKAEALAEPLGVVLAGSGYHGVAVNSCVSDGLRVAREVLAKLAKLGRATGALMLLATLVACSGNSGTQVERSGHRDGGDASVASNSSGPGLTPKGAAAPYRLAAVDRDGRLVDPGQLHVQVAWADPPAGLLRSPGANACGTTRAPSVSVHTLHGLRGAVVRIEGIERGVAPAAAATSVVAIRDCVAEPRVQVAARLGATVAIANDDARRHELALQRQVSGSLDPVARFPLALVGQRYELALEEPGLYRVSGDSVADEAWIVVPEHPYIAVTDDKGRVAFPEVPAGSYQVAAWHPPLRSGGPALRAKGSIVIEAGKVAELTLEPGPR